ncbi:uncharacterized protein LOC129603001 [Betta splendens]|uniref:Uncharacterized protein LOC129603001 n=1 Tax=Betta splendens TaxID=158456 RepID=A0A9W2X9K4_BETSP|nr:uncharacterized protein LOC129603001 [Betta splendens]
MNVASSKGSTSKVDSSFLEHSWISVSVAQSQNVNVQPGQSVTLRSPILNANTVMTWSRLINKTTASCICLMARSTDKAQFCGGFNNGTFQVEVNTTGVFLTIKNVNLSDSGIYFCEFFNRGNNVYYVIHLNVNGSEETQDDLDTMSQKCNKTDGTTYVMSLILGGLTVFLLMVVTGVIVSLGKREADPQLHENVDCDDLKAAALSVFSPAVRSRRPASQRQVETHVTYAASR